MMSSCCAIIKLERAEHIVTSDFGAVEIYQQERKIRDVKASAGGQQQRGRGAAMLMSADIMLGAGQW